MMAVSPRCGVDLRLALTSPSRPDRDPRADRGRVAAGAHPGRQPRDDDGAQVAEITALLDLSPWPAASRVIVRREVPHPGAQLSFTDHDGHRFQAVLTDQPDPDIASRLPRKNGRPRITRRTALSSTGTRTCSWCGKHGHDRRSCDVPPNAGKCSVCGFHGHDKRNCPRK